MSSSAVIALARRPTQPQQDRARGGPGAEAPAGEAGEGAGESGAGAGTGEAALSSVAAALRACLLFLYKEGIYIKSK